jgi:large subunit ribosomal protein L9
MRVILMEEVEHLGSIGAVLSVKDGYARNYLFPKSLAVVANESNKRELEHKKRVLQRRRDQLLAKLKEQASAIDKLSVTVSKQVGEDERIFGTVTTAELEELLLKEGVKVDRKDIHLAEDIKKVGVYSADVKLHAEVSAKFKVWVVAQ